MNALRADILARIAAAVLLGAVTGSSAWAQAANFDDKPTGFLTVRTGGMRADAWAGTSLAAAKRLVSALPAAPRSRALRDLQFKVLVSELTPPAADGSPPPSLFARKVEKLAAMGEGESLNEMVRSAGGYLDPTSATTVANAMMMAGERQGACSIVRNWELTEPFARRAAAACKLVSGEGGGGAPVAGQLDGPSVLTLDASRGQPPASALSSTQPPVIRALVGMKSLPIATRLDIAERGEALAIVEATRLADLYVQAVREGAALPPAMARRAQLVAAARNAGNPDEIMNSIIAVYSEERGSPLFPTIARASAAGLLNLPAKPQFARVAQEAMRGFLLLGDKQQAKAWTKLALSAAYNDQQALAALDRLLPLAAIAGIDDPKRLPPAEVNRWYDVLRRDDPARAPLRGYLLLELFRATGIDVPAGSTQLPDQPPANVRLVMPAAATLQALQAAAAGRRVAETALLASIAAGETPLAELHPAGVAAIVRALRAVGEDHAARLFATEVAIAYGL
jgi:hypothetical protein